MPEAEVFLNITLTMLMKQISTFKIDNNSLITLILKREKNIIINKWSIFFRINFSTLTVNCEEWQIAELLTNINFKNRLDVFLERNLSFPKFWGKLWSFLVLLWDFKTKMFSLISRFSLKLDSQWSLTKYQNFALMMKTTMINFFKTSLWFLYFSDVDSVINKLIETKYCKTFSLLVICVSILVIK